MLSQGRKKRGKLDIVLQVLTPPVDMYDPGQVNFTF